MKYKFKPNFFAILIVLIVGAGFFRQFNAEDGTFNNPILSIIYGIVVLGGITSMFKKNNTKT